MGVYRWSMDLFPSNFKRNTSLGDLKETRPTDFSRGQKESLRLKCSNTDQCWSFTSWRIQVGNHNGSIPSTSQPGEAKTRRFSWEYGDACINTNCNWLFRVNMLCLTCQSKWQNMWKHSQKMKETSEKPGAHGASSTVGCHDACACRERAPKWSASLLWLEVRWSIQN